MLTGPVMAEELQERMRQKGLMRSGCPVSATLRPEVLSWMQYEKLTKMADHLSAILEQVEPLILRTSAFFNRWEPLPPTLDAGPPLPNGDQE